MEESAIQLGSDITEVQNVVDVAFGSMSGMVEDFANTSIENFGLSKLPQKNIPVFYVNVQIIWI